MLWKRNKDIVTVGHQIVDKNVRLEETKNGNSLVVGPASPDDEAVRYYQSEINGTAIMIIFNSGLHLSNLIIQAI